VLLAFAALTSIGRAVDPFAPDLFPKELQAFAAQLGSRLIRLLRPRLELQTPIRRFALGVVLGFFPAASSTLRSPLLPRRQRAPWR
jgi:hypothetical protein